MTGSMPKLMVCRTNLRFHGAPELREIRLGVYLEQRGVAVYTRRGRSQAAACSKVRYQSLPQTRSSLNGRRVSESSCRRYSERLLVARLARLLREIPRSPSVLGYKPVEQRSARPDLLRPATARDCRLRLGERGGAFQRATPLIAW